MSTGPYRYRNSHNKWNRGREASAGEKGYAPLLFFVLLISLIVFCESTRKMIRVAAYMELNL